MGKLEREYQAGLISRLERRFPGCIILKNDEHYRPGFPDLTILYGEKYSVLEVKRSEEDANKPGPNQLYYIDMIVQMGGHAGFVYPENEHEVFNALQRAFGS